MRDRTISECPEECENSAQLVIIGAGPAGMTAALYASRAGLDTILLEHDAPGGKLLKTSEIANWPGALLQDGADLALKMSEQAAAAGARHIYGEAVSVSCADRRTDGKICRREKNSHPVSCSSSPRFRIRLADGTELWAEAVIAASGTKERTLGVPGEEENIGRGVSYCAVCDGAFCRGSQAAVIGAGNSALEEADYLTRFAKKVIIVMRRDVFRADSVLVDRACRNPKIEILRNAVPLEILSAGNRVTGLRIRLTETGEERLLDVQNVFPYIGADPVTGFLEGLDVLDDKGYIWVDGHMRTSVPGLYGAGDVTDKFLRQIVTAVSDGAVAAQDALHIIRSRTDTSRNF